jgi:hypothetical protein
MKTTYKISFFLFALAITSVSFWACNRTVKNDEVLGNTLLKSAPADFAGVISPSNGIPLVWNPKPSAPQSLYHQQPITDPDFTANGARFGINPPDRIYFTDVFSHEVTWFVEFTGAQSGAKKLFTGTSSYLDTTMVIWDGRANNFEYRFFIRGEVVNYKLSFLGSSINYSGSFSINLPASAASTAPLIKYNLATRLLPDGQILTYKRIDDFDATGQLIRTSYSDAADGAGAARFFLTDSKQVEGYFSYYMKATDNNGNGYCGGSSGELLTELQNYTALTDPSKIFFNVYVYGYGRPNSSLFLQAFENDFANPPSFPLPRDNSKNDMYYTIIGVDWVGWRLVSIPYSSFKPANNPASGGGGNRIKEPHKLCGFGIELDSYPTPGLTVELAIDAIYMTENAPFQQ